MEAPCLVLIRDTSQQILHSQAFPSMKRKILDVVLTNSSWYFNVLRKFSSLLKWHYSSCSQSGIFKLTCSAPLIGSLLIV